MEFSRDYIIWDNVIALTAYGLHASVILYFLKFSKVDLGI